jgi:hypothetical protein
MKYYLGHFPLTSPLPKKREDFFLLSRFLCTETYDENLYISATFPSLLKGKVYKALFLKHCNYSMLSHFSKFYTLKQIFHLECQERNFTSQRLQTLCFST